MFLLEAFPLAGGVAVGGVVCLLGLSGRVQAAVVVIASLFVGLVASVATGELEESVAFLVWDAVQAAVGSLVVLAAVRYRERRTAQDG